MINYPLTNSTWDDKKLATIQKVINTNMFTMDKQVVEYEDR